ncbi:MAG: hypothetical protein ACJA0H_001997, partial [Francisellaceae bacterium]
MTKHFFYAQILSILFVLTSLLSVTASVQHNTGLPVANTTV